MKKKGDYDKKEEYEAFIQILKKGQITHWAAVAQALGVHPDTIGLWKRRPEARKAIAEGIQHALQEMQRVGKNDWRMWETTLKLFGVNPGVNLNVKNDTDPISEILEAYGIERRGKELDDGQADTEKTNS